MGGKGETAGGVRGGILEDGGGLQEGVGGGGGRGSPGGAGTTTTGCSIGREEVSEGLGEGGSGGMGCVKGTEGGLRDEEEWGRGLGRV